MNYQGFRFGLYEKALPEDLGWLERLSLAKEAGYSFMEISIDETDEKLERLNWDLSKKNQLQSDIRESGIPLLSLCLSGHRRFPIGSANREVVSRGMEIMFNAIRFASDLGIRIVQLAGYDVLIDEKSTEETRENYLINLKKSVSFAASNGVILAMENIGMSFIDSISQAGKVVRELCSPYLQIYADIGNLSAVNLDLKKELQAEICHIVGLHIKDTREGEIRRVPFGKGTVDFVSAFQTIRETGFSGFLLVEMWADNNPNAFEKARDARLWLLDKMNFAWNLNESTNRLGRGGNFKNTYF